MSEILANVIRGGMVESNHRGDLAVVDADGKLIFSLGNPQTNTFWRSAAKPFQAITLVEEGGVERFALTDKELALIVSSHGGEMEHTKTAAGILKKIGRSEDDLDCGPSAPMNSAAAENLVKNSLPFLPVHNDCSGKHSGMLALCVLKGWPVKGYIDIEHPVQKNNLKVISEMTGVKMADIKTGIDGCGVPVFFLPVHNMALAYARLSQPELEGNETRRKALQKILSAMISNPFYIAGTGRLDTALMEVTGGRLVAKVGAESLYCVGLVGKGKALCLKIEDGNYRALGPVVVEALHSLGWLSEEEFIKLQDWWRPLIKNHRGETVGHIEAAFRL